jgi:RNA polymerase sigma-70 factor (ECF subfamily)
VTQKEKDEIYKGYNRKVFYYFIGKHLDEDDAEDLTANVFVKFYDKSEFFDPSKSSPSTLIYRIAHNTLIDFWRVRKQHSELDEEISYHDETLENILTEETLTELGQALMRLSDRARALVVLVYYDNKTLKEAAEILKMSYSNSKIVMKNALAELKEFLA